MSVSKPEPHMTPSPLALRYLYGRRKNRREKETTQPKLTPNERRINERKGERR